MDPIIQKSLVALQDSKEQDQKKKNAQEKEFWRSGGEDPKVEASEDDKACEDPGAGVYAGGMGPNRAW